MELSTAFKGEPKNPYGYVSDDWENDPYLTGNPARDKLVDEGFLPGLKALGITPEQVKDPEDAKAYAAWLKAGN